MDLLRETCLKNLGSGFMGRLDGSSPCLSEGSSNETATCAAPEGTGGGYAASPMSRLFAAQKISSTSSLICVQPLLASSVKVPTMTPSDEYFLCNRLWAKCACR